jgi:hypothetical protein
MRLPTHLVDLNRVGEINLSGRGGNEREVSILLPKWTRVSAALHDYETTYGGKTIRLEVKKQANLQWFDSGKYYRLSAHDRDVRMMFIIHDGGTIDTILIAFLGEFIDWLVKNRRTDGWDDEVLRIAADFKKRFPALQFKARAHVAQIFEQAPELFDVIYRRNG